MVGTLSPEVGSQIINASLLRRLGRMIAVTALATVVIFFAIPRYSNTVWQGTKQEQIATVGFTEEVRLDDIGRILESPEQVMRVEFTDLQGRPYKVDGEPYFRGTVLCRITEARACGSSRRFGPRDPPVEYAEVVRSGQHRLAADHTAAGVAFGAVQRRPVLLRRRSPGNLDLNLYTRQLMLSDEDSERRGSFRYTLGTTAFRNGWQRDLIPAAIAHGARSRCWRRPTKGFRTISVATIRRWCKSPNSAIAQLSLEQASAFERSKALENHFRRSGIYTYSLDVNQNRNRRLDPIEDFVSNHHTGHCEYFAGALTLMLRSQGIPARMVVGYKGGEFNTVGNYYIVRQLHAHAWVEAFLTNDEVPEDERDMPEPLVHGCWLRLDPTPDVIEGTADGERFAVITTVREFIDYCQVLWDDYVLGLNSTRQQQAIYQPIARSLRMLGNNLFGAEAWKARASGSERAWSRLHRPPHPGHPHAAAAVDGRPGRCTAACSAGDIDCGGALPKCSNASPRTKDGPTHAGRSWKSTVGWKRRSRHLGLIRAPAQTPFEFAGVVEARLAEFGSHSSARRRAAADHRGLLSLSLRAAAAQCRRTTPTAGRRPAIGDGGPSREQLSPREQQTP